MFDASIGFTQPSLRALERPALIWSSLKIVLEPHFSGRNRLSSGQRVCRLKGHYRDRAFHGQRLAKRLDALDLVHSFRGEVGLAAFGARPHGNSLDDEQAGALAKTARDMLELNAVAAAMRAVMFKRRRQ
jgi:hypothetical protein